MGFAKGLFLWILCIALSLALISSVAAFAGARQLGAPAQSAPALRRGPYLQAVTTGSAVVVWDTDVAANSRVDYGLGASGELSVVNYNLSTHHAVTLTELYPYTLYYYSVSSGGVALGEGSFCTAAPISQTAFSFVKYGDTQARSDMHQRVVDRMLTLRPDFALHTGDLVNNGGDAGEWDTFFAVERDFLRQTPFFPTLGNHEYRHKNYFDAFHLPNNERWYSFDYGPAHFTALEIDWLAAFAPGSQQYAWLENDLAASQAQWKIVFFHVPPFTSGPHQADKDIPALQAALPPLFARYGVDLVFNGHDHGYERSVVDGVTYVVSAGGGGPLYDPVHPNPYSLYYTNTLHFVHVTIDGDTLSAVGIRPDGVQFDPFTLTSAP